MMLDILTQPKNYSLFCYFAQLPITEMILANPNFLIHKSNENDGDGIPVIIGFLTY